MSRPLSLGFSPCPNDTFIFAAMVHGQLGPSTLTWQEPLLADVEQLNNWALAGRLDVTKLSCHALGHVLDEYCLLSAGAALGRGCGPLLVAGSKGDRQALRGKRVAIPGRYTTAALLLQMLLPDCLELVEMRFDLIMAAVKNNSVDAGVIIHESRFTYQEEGLHCIEDLGQWWEDTTGQPIPLGCIVARRSLGVERISEIDAAIRASVNYAWAHPDAAMPYIRAHSQELSAAVVRSHIDLYVNDFSRDLGDEGLAAISDFLHRGRQAGVLPEARADLQLRRLPGAAASGIR